MSCKKTEWLKFSSDQEEIAFPLATIEGTKPGPTVTITAGIHGCEYPGIASAIRLFKELTPETVAGKIQIVTISSLKAFESRSMFVCPVDGKNPNRVFPGDKNGSYTQVLAYHLFNDVILKGDYYLDLHGGDMVEALVPFAMYHKSGNDKIDQKSLEIAKYYGLKNVVSTTWPDSKANSGTTYDNASEHGIPGALVEAGSIGQLDEESVNLHMKGLYNVLRYLGCLEGEPVIPTDQTIYDELVWVYTPKKGIFYTKVNVGDEISKSQCVGTIEDYFGNQIEEIQSPTDGKVLCLTSSPAVKDNGLLMEVASKPHKD
jgi:predicted deacylase